jgi:hypothetical protein
LNLRFSPATKRLLPILNASDAVIEAVFPSLRMGGFPSRKFVTTCFHSVSVGTATELGGSGEPPSHRGKSLVE